MRLFLRHVLIAGAIALTGGLIFALGGFYNVAARSSHWAPIYWFLHETYRSSVDLHANGVPAPPRLDDPALIQLGAAHFESGCRACHGAPGLPRGAVARAMEPVPPPIAEAVANWDERELHWIVNNGVKMSGMPHWPAEKRSDEVWAVVAFLRQVRAMSPADYRRLALEPAGPVAELGARGTVANCARCHEMSGRPRYGQIVPRLDGLSREYLIATLRAYRDGGRPSGIMATQAIGLSDAEIVRLADHYAAAPGPSATACRLPRTSEQPALLAEGRAIAHGLPRRGARLPACAACHGPGSSNANPRYPRLAGQPASYIERELTLYAEGLRAGSRQSALMRRIAPMIKPEQRRAVAAYYANLVCEPQP